MRAPQGGDSSDRARHYRPPSDLCQCGAGTPEWGRHPGDIGGPISGNTVSDSHSCRDHGDTVRRRHSDRRRRTAARGAPIVDGTWIPIPKAVSRRGSPAPFPSQKAPATGRRCAGYRSAVGRESIGGRSQGWQLHGAGASAAAATFSADLAAFSRIPAKRGSLRRLVKNGSISLRYRTFMIP